MKVKLKLESNLNQSNLFEVYKKPSDESFGVYPFNPGDEREFDLGEDEYIIPIQEYAIESYSFTSSSVE
jgi:hypothetical protein